MLYTLIRPIEEVGVCVILCYCRPDADNHSYIIPLVGVFPKGSFSVTWNTVYVFTRTPKRIGKDLILGITTYDGQGLSMQIV